MGRLNGKLAIVTGAAAGIGRAIATKFIDEGAMVIAVDADRIGLSELEAQLQTSRQQVEAWCVDITYEAAVQECFESVYSRYGKIDILVNDAAIFVLKGVDATLDDWRKSFNVNVFGTATCTKHASRYMTQQGSGSIVNLSSISGVVAQPLFLTYSTTKAAIIQMTRNLALDLGVHGIRVNCISPGTIVTSASENHAAKLEITLEEFEQREGKKTALNRVGRPQDVASAVVFLASDEASFITGANLMVDGGYSIM